jgi:hypothetical protein
MFDWLVSGGWHHSAWDRRDIIHSSEDKVHFDTRFTPPRVEASWPPTTLSTLFNQNLPLGSSGLLSFAP